MTAGLARLDHLRLPRIMGIGLGMCMQILILIVQNSFPLREVGTATASNNYFRQIGASLGSADRWQPLRRPAHLAASRADATRRNAASAGISNSFTPELVKSLPAAVRALSSAPTTTR